jgi:light-regulated signal transduction histidine kinase (bacteriophytochrome)
LRSLHGYSQILIEEYSDRLDEDARGHLQRLQANAVKMAQLIDDLLRLSRTTRIQLHRERVDLTAIFREVVAELHEADPDRTTEIEVDDHLETDGDGSLLQLAVHNLLANAWKFTATTPHARIEVGHSMQDGERVFHIRDNGVGFDPKYAEKLFQPFQRLHSRETFNGSGIGLAIVFRVIQRHGGRVWAESSPGEGATFFFTVTPAPVRGPTSAKVNRSER